MDVNDLAEIQRREGSSKREFEHRRKVLKKDSDVNLNRND